MAKISCFPTLLAGKKKKSKESVKALDTKKSINSDLSIKLEEFIDSYVEKSLKDGSLEGLVECTKSPSCDTNVVGVESQDEYSVRLEKMVEAAYEDGDEHEDVLSMTRDYFGFDLQALDSHDFNQGRNSEVLDNKSGEVEQVISHEVIIHSGHASDPEMQCTTEFWGSPLLKRSCSNIETKRGSKLLKSPNRSHFFDNPQNTSGNYGEVTDDILCSPLSVKTSCSADKDMLKKRSSSQVLPSRSRKLWWKLFLWSHQNLHKPWSYKPQGFVFVNESSNQKGGYCSNMLETSNIVDMKNKIVVQEPEINKTGVWPEYQWVAFSTESSSVDRVNAWVHSLDDCSLFPVDGSDNDDVEETITPFTCITFMEIGECSRKNQTNRRTMEEVVQANNITQSLNTFSSLAHISSMGLKTIPAIAGFTSLRAVNLSGNFIVHISPGSLPKSLHTLDLSRNKISTIEGLMSLTRLRVLNLSYNRISRIGHGLANCTLIKELYLAGNKISDVDGLHRLLKLTVVDLSFNKITTSKALGQLVANYNSLLALNLLGNPIQSNIGYDHLRKAVLGLLPQLAYLNKQPIKPKRAMEVESDRVAKAALGNSGWNSWRRSTRRIGESSSTSIKGRIGEGSSRPGASISDVHKNRHRSNSRHSSRK